MASIRFCVTYFDVLNQMSANARLHAVAHSQLCIYDVYTKL